MTSNCYPLSFPMDSFYVERVPYKDGALGRLRSEYNEDNSFFRVGEHIYVSPMGAQQVPGTQGTTLSVTEDRYVVGSLVRHMFFRTFRDKYPSILPLSFYPFRIFSRKGEHDLLLQALGDLRFDPAPLGGRVSNRKLIEVQFRDIVHEGSPTLVAVINVRYSWTYGDGVSCASLHADGLDLSDREVLLVEPLPGLEGVLAPDETLIGVVRSVSAGEAAVETNDGLVTHPLGELVPRRSRQNVDAVLGLYLGEHRVDKVRRAVREWDSSRLDARAYRKEVAHMASTVSQLTYRNGDNFTFEISRAPLSPGQSFEFSDPIFRFDYAPGASDERATRGLVKHGPYDSRTFQPKTPRVAVVCHPSSRNAFSSFLGKLRDGIPEARYFSGGMRGKYMLNDLSFDAAADFIEVPTFSGDAYEEAVARYLSRRDGERRADIVFIQTKDEFKSYAPSQNPYFRAKARLMMEGIPSQFLKTETIRKDDRYLQYPLDSISLQAYAKMGGVPYVLPAGNNVDREIVVGIGHATTRSNAFHGNEQERVVGITTFFKADGEYIFGTRCREVPYDEYFQALLDNLRASIEDIATGYGWRDGDAVRLVFHVFKPVKDVEAEVVARLVHEYPQYAITFAFVTVTDRHPFVLFDERNKQGRSIRGQQVGHLVPRRRTNWALSDESCLIQLHGVDEMSTAYHGFSTPVLVRIHELSTYRDLHAISQQVFNFTFLSWRSFKPSRTPVTIDYANQIAGLLTNLRKVDKWRPESVNSPEMRRKKWFL